MSRESLTATLLLAVTMIFTGYYLLPELTIGRYDLNDNVAHVTIVERMATTLSAGGSPLDFWVPEFTFGYPVARTYQLMPYGLVVGVYFLMGKTLSLLTVFLWVKYLAIVFLPVSFFLCGRLLGLPSVTAAIAGALSPLVATNGLYGLELNSYLWAGGGLFTQVVALHPMLAALGFGYRAMRTGRGLTLTGALIGVVMMCHIVYGYFSALTMGMLWLLPLAGSTRRERFWRLGWIGATSMALTAFALLPLVTDGAFLNRSRWEPVWKWDSFGAAAVMEWLFTGQLMDYGRMPLLTVAAAVGAGMAGWAIYRSKDTVERFLLGGAIFWILLFFGRPAWGGALLLLGMTQDMHIHRAIGPVQIFLLFLAAMGVAGAWRKYKVAMAVLSLLALVPMVQERARVFTLNREWGERNLRANEAAAPNVNRVIDLARNAGGRTYAGLGANWGANLKVGDVPVYARLARAHVPALSYLYHAMPLAADLMVRFDEQNVAHYRLFHIRTVIGAVGARMPGFLLQAETTGTFGVWQAPGGGAFECVDVPAAMQYTRENLKLKSDWGLGRFRLRGLVKAGTEALWMAIAFNVQMMLTLRRQRDEVCMSQ